MWNELDFWNELERMHNDFFGLDEHPANRLLGGKGRGRNNLPAESSYRRPIADFEDKDDRYVATIELPGVKKDDININVEDNSMEIKVEKKSEDKKEEKGGYRYERRYAGFYRCFGLPTDADSENIDAKYEDGLLELDIPKKVESESRKKIDVK